MVRLSRIAMTLMVAVSPGLRADSPVGSAEPPKEMVELRKEGYAANYNLDYAAARVRFEEIRRRWPTHPAGDLYLANIVWLEHLYKIRRLQMGIYQDESFYAGFEGSQESGEKGDVVDPQVDRTFRDLIASAKGKALTMVNANRNDPYAKYYLGSIYSILAAYEASTARRFWSALRNGSRGIESHQQVLKMKTDFWDARLSIGMYEYVIGNLPFAARAIIAIGGVRGSKENGISQLKQIIEHNGENSDDARVMLIGIFQNENRSEEALGLLTGLSAQYPANFLFRLESASTLSRLRRDREAVDAFESLIASSASGSPAARSIDLIRFQYGEALLRAGSYEKASEQYLASAREAVTEPGLSTRATLRAGQMFDLLGKREAAIAHYQAVLKRPNVLDSQNQARKGLARPYEK